MTVQRRRSDCSCSASPRRRVAFSAWITVLCLLGSSINTNALSLSMVASRAPYMPGFGQGFGSASSHVTGGLISNLAVVALKLRLARQTGVDCDVTANSADLLLHGRVGPVTVKGRGWQSRLGLTCRAIEATVDTCHLDMGRILADQKLVLNTPAKGNAMIALNSADFGNFITHPLMKPPGIPSSSGEDRIKFQKEGVHIEPSRGRVTFFGDYVGETWKCTLRRSGTGNGKNAMVHVEPTNVDSQNKDLSVDLSQSVTDFFNDMVFELDGTYLGFQDMMVTSKGATPSIMLALKIVVEKFPSPGLAF